MQYNMKSISDMTREELKEHLFKLHPKVLLASIPDNISDNNPLLNELMQAVYDKNFEAFRLQFTGTEIASLEPEYIREQKHKLTEFDLMLHSTANRIKVVRYLQFLGVKEETVTAYKPTEKKQYKSLIRVHCFILARAYLKDKHDEIKDCSEREFYERVKKIFSTEKPRQYYLMVRSKYKEDSNYLNYYDEMAIKHPEDYDYAMMLYKEYYPKISVYFPKKN